MSWLNVLYEIRDNIKSAQTESQVNVQCEECLKWFSSRKSLSNHKPIHQGRTKCEHCEISFSTLGSLRRHVKSHHSVPLNVNEQSITKGNQF